MNKKHAWKVEPELIDRFLDVFADNDFKWMTGHIANEFRPLQDKETLLFVEVLPKILMYMGYSYYLNEEDEEYNISEVTEELLEVMEYDGVVSTLVPERLRKDIWKLICGMEECESDMDEEDECEYDPVNNPSHYNHGELETIEIIRMMLSEEEYRGYLKGNILKYRERAPYKGNAEEDYAKAKWYFYELMTIGF